MLVSTYLRNWSAERIKGACWGPTPPFRGSFPSAESCWLAPVKGSEAAAQGGDLISFVFLSLLFSQGAYHYQLSVHLSFIPEFLRCVGHTACVGSEWNSHSRQLSALVASPSWWPQISPTASSQPLPCPTSVLALPSGPCAILSQVFKRIFLALNQFYTRGWGGTAGFSHSLQRAPPFISFSLLPPFPFPCKTPVVGRITNPPPKMSTS